MTPEKKKQQQTKLNTARQSSQQSRSLINQVKTDEQKKQQQKQTATTNNINNNHNNKRDHSADDSSKLAQFVFSSKKEQSNKPPKNNKVFLTANKKEEQKENTLQQNINNPINTAQSNDTNFMDMLEKALDCNFSMRSASPMQIKTPQLDMERSKDELQSIINISQQPIKNMNGSNFSNENEMFQNKTGDSIEFDAQEIIAGYNQNHQESLNIVSFHQDHIEQQVQQQKPMVQQQDIKNSQFYQIVLQQIHQMRGQIQYLDQQLTKSKSIIVQQQSFIQQQQQEINGLQTQLQQQQQQSQQNQQINHQTSQKNLKQSRDKFETTENIMNILKEIEKYRIGIISDPFEELDKISHEQDQQDQRLDQAKIKQVTMGMNQEQQELVGDILKQLAKEQQMRLQSEEQNNRMIESMEENQRKLELQLKQVKSKVSQQNLEKNGSSFFGQSPGKNDSNNDKIQQQQ